VGALVPATTTAVVTAVDSIREHAGRLGHFQRRRAGREQQEMPAHSQVAPWKKRCGPGWWVRLAQRGRFNGQLGVERVRKVRCPGCLWSGSARAAEVGHGSRLAGRGGTAG
jgi:hypothetical protein